MACAYDPQGHRLEFNLATNTGVNVRDEMCVILQQDLARLGIKVNYRPLEFTTLVDKLDSTYDWDVVLIGFTGGIEPNNGADFLRSSGALHLWYPKEPKPATPWEAEIDQLLEQGTMVMDPLKRAPYYWRIQEILLPATADHRDGAPGALRGVEEYAGEFPADRVGQSTSQSGSSSGPSESRVAQPMTRFLIKRLLNMVPLIIGITFLSFLVMSLAPGNFLTNLKLNPAISPQVIHQLEAQFGLDQPLLVRYAKWLWQMVHLNLGLSMSYRVNVTSLIAARAFNTVILALASMIFAWVVAIPIGIVVAVKQNSIWDRALSFVAFFGMSVPNFFLAFLMMYLALRTGWFPVGGTFSPYYESLDHLGPHRRPHQPSHPAGVRAGQWRGWRR